MKKRSQNEKLENEKRNVIEIELDYKNSVWFQFTLVHIALMDLLCTWRRNVFAFPFNFTFSHVSQTDFINQKWLLYV